ncbi:uncharacterized protein [Diabrotica undecimpunctata]|uniref:uncharacterized protein n=1 Tax=Diabrotica undecimpunctata TaxID=50387 RepID=UPI003B641FDA
MAIPLVKKPKQTVVASEDKRSTKEVKIITNIINKLMLSSAISIVDHTDDQYISKVFTIPKSDGSYRLILNLKKFNKFVENVHFKIEDNKVVVRLISQGCFMSKIDLKDAYHLIPVQKSHRKYLRFIFKGTLYEYNCLPFGLSCAPRIFTKILKPIVGILREKGVLLTVYLDDFLILGKSYKECEHNNASPSVERPFPGGREIIRKALLKGDVPKDSLDVCLCSITSSTLKQYNLGLRLWWEFCSKANTNPYKVTVPNVLEFLTFHFKKGAAYGSLNSYRSAIAQIAGPELAQDYRIKRFFKGIFSLRRPLPRYENTWDPGIALKYLRTLENNTISLEILTKKLVTLLALATGQRIQTLSLIDIDNIIEQDGKIEIKISDRTKTTAINKTQPLLVLPFFGKDPNICVARTLKVYLEKTKELRGSCRALLLTHKKPFHKATPQTIGRWIKFVLQQSGLDISQFKAHSTRHAATSAAARKGVSFDTIRLAAGWTQNSKTFAKFYNRPLVCNKEFANTILNM